MPSTSPRYDLLITGARILTAEPEAPYIENGVIGIAGDRLALVAPVSAETQGLEAKRRIDVPGHIVTPGFDGTFYYLSTGGNLWELRPTARR